MHEAKIEIKTEFTAMVNKKVVSLEACVEARVNEVHQDTISTLEEWKATMAAVCASPERMWGVINGMSKEV